MSTPTLPELLTFADLQLAAEALYRFDATTSAATLIPGDVDGPGALLSANLELGNRIASMINAAYEIGRADAQKAIRDALGLES